METIKAHRVLNKNSHGCSEAEPVDRMNKNDIDPGGVEEGDGMATYTQILYHIVYGTKNHNDTLDLERHDELCKYTAGILKNKNCFVYKIGGYTEHIHIVTELHPTLTLADLVKDIKLSQSKWIKTNNIFSGFEGWQDGYGGFSCSWRDKDRVINYIANQTEHHRQKSFHEEYVEMLQKAGIRFDEKYLS